MRSIVIQSRHCAQTLLSCATLHKGHEVGSHDDDDEERRERTDSKAVAHLRSSPLLLTSQRGRCLLRDTAEHCNYCASEMTRNVSRQGRGREVLHKWFETISRYKKNRVQKAAE